MNCSHGIPFESKCWKCMSEGLERVSFSHVGHKDQAANCEADPFKKMDKQVDKNQVLLHNKAVS